MNQTIKDLRALLTFFERRGSWCREKMRDGTARDVVGALMDITGQERGDVWNWRMKYACDALERAVPQYFRDRPIGCTAAEYNDICKRKVQLIRWIAQAITMEEKRDVVSL